MKKLFLLLIAIFAFSGVSTVSAQNDSKLYISPSVGIISNSLYSENFTGMNFTAGYYLGQKYRLDATFTYGWPKVGSVYSTGLVLSAVAPIFPNDKILFEGGFGVGIQRFSVLNRTDLALLINAKIGYWIAPKISAGLAVNAVTTFNKANTVFTGAFIGLRF